MNPSTVTLLQELEHLEISERRRLRIGEILAKRGDERRGAGVKNGTPDIEWLPIAPGGSAEIVRQWRPDTPDDEVKIVRIGHFSMEPFYIAKYLVTHCQYQTFVEAEDGFDNAIWWQGMPRAYQRQKLREQRIKLLNHPRDGISWYQSVAFARWMNHRLQGREVPHLTGKSVLRVGHNAHVRLPTEWEWQWAAQNGAEARPFPWGEIRTGYANTSETRLEQSTAVGMYPHGAAACGALDMAGNLMEWCANDKANLDIIDVGSAASKALRGGDWGSGIENATCIYCDDEDPGRADVLNGCRLVLASA